MQRLFSPEHLAGLSIEEYVLLLKRFPSEIVTHVTRQGLRDHIGHEGHTVGLMEYHDEFKKIIQEGRLKSATGVYFKDGMSREAMAEMLRLPKIDSREAALGMIKTWGERMARDKSAVHFAVEDVANAFYGGEDGNEIFFAFPSALMAANNYFEGTALNAEASMNNAYNDSYIWTEDDKGIDVNSGIVFIPGSADVDSKTGSTYMLDENMQPVENTENFDLLQKIILDDEIFELSKKISYSSENNELIKQAEEIVEEKYGSNPDITAFLRDYRRGLRDINSVGSWERGLSQDEYQKAYQERGGLEKYVPFMLPFSSRYRRPQNTIKSSEYWENYFAVNPEQKPNKIQYYFQDEPGDALSSWKRRNGLTKKSSTTDFGFPEHIGMPEAENKVKKFMDVAYEAVDYVFPETP